MKIALHIFKPAQHAGTGVFLKMLHTLVICAKFKSSELLNPLTVRKNENRLKISFLKSINLYFCLN
jgi:hypothetical protein